MAQLLKKYYNIKLIFFYKKQLISNLWPQYFSPLKKAVFCIYFFSLLNNLEIHFKVFKNILPYKGNFYTRSLIIKIKQKISIRLNVKIILTNTIKYSLIN